MVMSFSLRSRVHFEPLKSKRCPISRRMPSSALSTSAISVFETMSKEGIYYSNILSGTVADGGDLVADRVADVSEIDIGAVIAQSGLALAGAALGEPGGVESVDGGARRGLEADHDAVAGARRLLIIRLLNP